MGLARDLTMGPKRPRNRHSGTSGDYAILRRLTQAENPDLGTFRAVLQRVGSSPERLRFAEGVVYTAACERYRALTGEDFGPRLGIY